MDPQITTRRHSIKVVLIFRYHSRNRHVAPLLRLAQKTNDSELVDVINKLVASSPLDLNQKTRKESILYCRREMRVRTRWRQGR